MWIKFKVEGELEELIKIESEDECSTCSQQALYILKNYYKDRKRQDNSNLEQSGIEWNKTEVNRIKQNTIEQNVTKQNEIEQTGTISSNTVKNSSDIEQSVLDEVCAF